MAYASAVALTVIEISRAGKSVTEDLVTPTATHGNKFINDGRTMLRVKNGSAGPIVVTVNNPSLMDGLEVADLTVTIKATADADGLDFQDIGPFPVSFNQTDGYVWVTCATVTDMLVGAYRLPKF